MVGGLQVMDEWLFLMSVFEGGCKLARCNLTVMIGSMRRRILCCCECVCVC